MLTCYIIDDEKYALETITDYINQTQELKLIGTETNPLTAVSEIRNGLIPDILFTDVDMPGLNGLELVELLKDIKMVIIFISAHSKYAINAFDLETFGYLMKPVRYSKFLKVVQRLFLSDKPTEVHDQATDNSIFIKGDTKGKLLRVELSDVFYIESEQNYIVIVTENESITTYLMISEIISHLPEQQFSRVHRSFIVNHLQINSISDKKIILKNGVHIPLSNSYKSDFLAKINRKTLISGRTSC